MTARHDLSIRLRKPLERAIAQGHPWIYRDALEDFSAPVGAIASITDGRGRFLARGITDQGPIALRVFTTRDELVGEGLFAARIARAAELRDRVITSDTTAYRLLHGEGDRMPGVVVDVYGPSAVLSFDGSGVEVHREAIFAALRPTLDARKVTSLLVRTGRGDKRTLTAAWGDPPTGVVHVTEHGMTLAANLTYGQKTGLFLDQRESRRRVRELTRGMRVLNLYGYTGGFSVAAGLGGARAVETVDVAASALDLANASWKLNGLPEGAHTTHARDVPELLAEKARSGARYECVIADPPSFAPSEAALEAALKSYRQLHASAIGLVTPGGYYVAGSCSSHVNRTMFEESVCDGAAKAHRVVQLVDAWGAPGDHPRLAAFSEGDYLKVILARVLE